jgi:ABC-2 type transport system permease protein
MRNIIAIMKREVRSFFVSPIAYFVITGFVLIAGYFFFTLLGIFNNYLLQIRAMPFSAQQLPNLNEFVVQGLLQTMVVVLVFLVPLLTMRIFAEEKHRGTFELLVTSPVSVREIVLGKFFGVSVIIVLMLALIALFPALLVIFGEPAPEVGPIFSGFLGLFLCSLAFVSIGMAVSCFTENQVVAGITSMVTLLLLYVIQAAAQSAGGSIETILSYLSPIVQLKDLLQGVISLKSIIYFSSLVVVGLFFSQRALEAYRWR